MTSDLNSSPVTIKNERWQACLCCGGLDDVDSEKKSNCDVFRLDVLDTINTGLFMSLLSVSMKMIFIST